MEDLVASGEKRSLDQVPSAYFQPNVHAKVDPTLLHVDYFLASSTLPNLDGSSPNQSPKLRSNYYKRVSIHLYNSTSL